MLLNLKYCIPIQYICVPMIKVITYKAQAGIVGFESPAASQYEEKPLNLDALLISKPSATYIGLAQGDSMRSYGIFDGDLLIVDRSPEITHGDIIVANLNGEFVCKRLDKEQWRLVSSKPYSAYKLSENDEFQIEGVVISSVRLHKKLHRSLN